MKVMLACDFERRETLGSSRVPLRLAAELTRLGVEVATVFSEEVPRLGQPRLDQASAPARMASALRSRAAACDIVDIAGGDGWVYSLLKRWLRPRQRVVSLFNGLWLRALAAERHPGRTAGRDLASDLYQKAVLCRWERQSIAGADLSVFGASPDADDVVRLGWTTADRVAVVAPGVDDYFESPVPLNQRRHLAFIGTMHHRKGSDIMAAAVSRVLQSRPEVELTLFGPGLPPEQALDAFAPAVRDRVRVVSALPPAEMARRLGQFAVLVFPTRYEGFGLVVLEAMRAGLVVVTTPTGAGFDVVRDGRNGLVVPIEDVKATVAAVQRLIDDTDLRLKLATGGLEEARSRPWSRTARELLAAYGRVLAHPPLKGRHG